MRARLDTPLKRHLRGNGIKQSWLADQIGASRQEMSAWVNGIHVPVEPTRRAIASALGKTTDPQRVSTIVQDLWPDTETAEAA